MDFIAPPPPEFDLRRSLEAEGRLPVAGGVFPPFSAEPTNPRQAIAQSLLSQQIFTPLLPAPVVPLAMASPFEVLRRGLRAAQEKKRERERHEGADNPALSFTRSAPAFDDQGYLLPRTAGMAEPSGFERLRNFLERNLPDGLLRLGS